MSVSFQSAAIPKCYDRLRKADRALSRCEKASSFEDFASDWSDFLIHAGGVLHVIEAGSKQTPQGRQWYGGIKRFGRSDELLTYLFQARHAVEHTYDDPVEMKSQVVTIGYKQDIENMGILNINDEFFQNPKAALEGWVDTKGRPLTVTNTPAGPHAISVKDRHKTNYSPPMEHLGKPLLDRSSTAIGRHYIDYLRNLIVQARDLP